MRDWSPWQDLWCVVKDDGTYAGVPCLSYDEARELSIQHPNSMIFELMYETSDPFGFRFKED